MKKILEKVQAMSLEIDIGNFPNLYSVFEAIERQGEQFGKSEGTKNQKGKREPRSSATIEAQPTKRHSVLRRASDFTSHTLQVEQPRERIRSAPPCPLIDRAKLENDSRLTEVAKQLSDEELALLYEDILKPLDFYSLLHERWEKM